MENFVKIINPVMCDTGRKRKSRGFVKISYVDGRLSLCGVIGPNASGNALGSCGQCVDEIRVGIPTVGWDKGMVKMLCNIWTDWHLNSLRPYCQHQKELGWDKLESDVVDANGKQEKRGWLRFDKHELGLLGKPCPVCGYRYGTSWLKEDVPEEILTWLYNLPESKVEPAWV